MSWPYLRGEQHGKSKFTREQVEHIVKQYIEVCGTRGRWRGAVKEVALANPWMSPQNINFICIGKAWPHVTQPLLKQAGLLEAKYEFVDCDPVYQKSSPFWENMNQLAKQRREEARESE